MSKVFLIDISKCSGCYNCQFACKDEHCDNEWLPYAKKQPLIGQFWTRVTEHLEGTRPKVKIHYIPEMCNHCDNPECANVCPVGAITKRNDGLVLIDPKECVGCQQCMDACPYGSIYYNTDLGIAQKCTGCAHLVDIGKLPRCVDVCPTDAITFGEESELSELLKDATVRKPESGCGPKVYYKNIPGHFISGTIFDPIEEEVIKNAHCLLKNASEVYETFTDVFGDFWFKDLPAGLYDLTIEAEGFETKEWQGLDSSKSLNIGDIPFSKK